jgi:hypothetical protein
MLARCLIVAAWCSLAVAFVSAGLIVFDIYGRGRRQRLAVMEAVWPLTTLYVGPLGVWGYRRLGRSGVADGRHDRAAAIRPRWSGVALSVTHCGAGCVLGDVVAEFVVFAFGLSIAGQALYAEYLGDYLLAIGVGMVFQFLVISRMRSLTLLAGLAAAAKSDVIALSAFEIGLFGSMALTRLVLFSGDHLSPTSPVYWLFMQAGMALGFATSWPANAWLVRRGIKDAM